MAHASIRALAPHEWELFRALRLRALADAPDAFAATLAEARAYPDAAWQEQVAALGASGTRTLVLAESAGQPVGLAFGRLDDDRPGVAHLGAMWVDPAARRLGAARALARAIAAWARALGAEAIELQVTEGNTPAERLYASEGFAPTGEVAPLPSNPALRVLTLRRELSRGPR